MVSQELMHVTVKLSGGELVHLVRPTQGWKIDRYEYGGPRSQQEMLMRGFNYVESFMEPWREIEFSTPQRAAAFVQRLIAQGRVPHS